MSYRLLSTNMIPPGGWEYRQPDTGEAFKKGCFGDLIAAVFKHRLSNGLKRADPESVSEDVQDQICKRVGHDWCEHMKAGQWGFSISLDRIQTGTKALLGWARAAFLGQDPYVDQAEANRRAAICANCWANKAIAGCMGCGLGGQIRDMLVEAKGNRYTPSDEKLHSCLVCECANQAQVWIKPEILAPAITTHQAECYGEIPGCWKANL